MTSVVVSAEVNRSAPEVFAYATDPARFHEWQAGVIEGHLDANEQPPAVGTRCLTTRRIGGANRSSTSVITHLDPPRTWGVRGIDGPIRAFVDVNVEPVTAGGCRLTISVDFQGVGIGKVLVPLLVRRQAERQMPRNVATLKRRVETLVGQ